MFCVLKKNHTRKTYVFFQFRIEILLLKSYLIDLAYGNCFLNGNEYDHVKLSAIIIIRHVNNCPDFMRNVIL